MNDDIGQVHDAWLTKRVVLLSYTSDGAWLVTHTVAFDRTSGRQLWEATGDVANVTEEVASLGYLFPLPDAPGGGISEHYRVDIWTGKTLPQAEELQNLQV